MDPCEDFYEFACGSFAKRHSIRSGRKEANYRTVVNRLKGDQLLSDDIMAPVKYVKRVWDSCVSDDSDTNDKVEKLLNYFEELDQLDWQDRFARLTMDGFNSIFTVRYNFHFLVIIGAPEVQLDAFYSAKDSSPLLEYYEALLQLLERQPDQSRPGPTADLSGEFLRIDLSLASTKTNEKESSPLSSSIGLGELSRLTRINWSRLLRKMVNTQALDHPITDYLQVKVEDIEYVRGLSEALDGKDSHFLARYMDLQVLHQSCFFLGKQCRDLQLKLFQAVDSPYVPKYQNKSEFVESTCFRFLRSNFEDLLFKVYHPKNLLDETELKQREFYSDLLNRLKGKLDKTIDKITWMDEETKEMARHPVETILYSNDFNIPPHFYYDNNLQMKYRDVPYVNSLEKKDILDHFRSIVHHFKLQELTIFDWGRYKKWPISIFATRPYLGQEIFRFFIPPFFLIEPFALANQTIQLGFVGWLLTREWVHVFDRVAASHFETLDPESFWSDWTRDEFNRAMQCLVDVYDGQEVDVELRGKAGKAKINGTFSLDENLADLIALDVAYEVYKELNSTSATDTSDFPDPLKELADERLFFLSFANVHCSHQLKPVDVKVVNTPPPKARVNTALCQTAKFADAFSCKPGSNMHPHNRCSFT